MKTYTITESKTQLSSLVQQVISTGKPVFIGPRGRPMVQLTVFQEPKPQRVLGAFRDEIQLSDDFDEWSGPEAAAFGMVV